MYHFACGLLLSVEPGGDGMDQRCAEGGCRPARNHDRRCAIGRRVGQTGVRAGRLAQDRRGEVDAARRETVWSGKRRGCRGRTLRHRHRRRQRGCGRTRRPQRGGDVAGCEPSSRWRGRRRRDGSRGDVVRRARGELGNSKLRYQLHLCAGNDEPRDGRPPARMRH